MTAARSRLAVSDSARGGKPLALRVTSALEVAMRHEPRPMRLTVVFVGDAQMRRLNRSFHGMDAPTDVLAFPLASVEGVRSATPEALGVDGEIVVSLGAARREARARRVPVAWEAVLYAIHGYLHLCGYDDHDAVDARLMATRTARILDLAGFEAGRLGVSNRGIEAPVALASVRARRPGR